MRNFQVPRREIAANIMRKLVNTKFLKEKSRKYTSRTFPAYSNIYNKKIDYDKKNPYKKIVHALTGYF